MASNNVQVKNVENIKYLGVIYDNKLNFKNNTKYILSKTESQIARIQ